MLTVEEIEEHTKLRAEYLETGLTEALIRDFRRIIYRYFTTDGRDFPWRRTANPYHIFVSELMLQQTQTERVVPKFEQFIRSFPDFEALASSPLKEILAVWQGLGYNRRALALQQSALKVVELHQGVLPDDPGELEKLPGIGKASAASISAFAFNKPVVFIETNIRAVFIYFFFQDRSTASDQQIRPLVEKTLDRDNPFRWYSALMDFGVNLKKTFPALTRKSSHYTKQTPFQGSSRQIRGKIIRLLLENGPLDELTLHKLLAQTQHDISAIINKMETEGLIGKSGTKLTLIAK